MRTIDWRDDHIVAVDQTALPDAVRMLDIHTVAELTDAIRRLAIRGAPALGVAGALGAALAAREPADVCRRQVEALRQARPTAVNLAWGVDRAMRRLPEGPAAVLAEALGILDEDVRANRALAARGADWLLAHGAARLNVQTHCNAGGLACVEWGTALGVVRALHERGALGRVYVDETRPLLQGSRLTTWELARLGIEHTLVVDSAGPSVLARGLADAVLVGADRIAANGDVINKIGTYPLALAAARAGIPFVVAAPESTLDPDSPTGQDVEIEIRDGAEIVHMGQIRTAPAGTPTLNLAFDLTPADLVTAIVTEHRVIHPAKGERP
ncbi:S-methyl-5-thioribose-1-phosphate isomerase [Actinophytocola sp.]|uniref:S-methyl-5-thioribose-1-phosphate isomerase n=1 Tax=Actinophytocola sp. TaxID=1872138 RepID=UPI002D7E8A59|nr:S-methyl-5-thioribose-1-phosphate isomerase [Actinophytocola sp.]HET9139974.1 S-methyl-5-thioribose-1-phosphate isomerase [Actinophytocola sp.]